MSFSTSPVLELRGGGRPPVQLSAPYRSLIETIALNCLVFEKIAFFAFWRQTDRQTDKQMDSSDAQSRSRYRERRLNKRLSQANQQRSDVMTLESGVVTGREQFSF